MRLLALALSALVLLAGPAGAEETNRANLEALASSGQADGASLRLLGELYASGRDGKKSAAEALRLWRAAAEAGDRRAPILIADRLYREIWGAPQPNGVSTRVGRLPRGKTEEAIRWYTMAFEKDDRAEIRSRAQVLAVSLSMTLQTQTPKPPPTS